MKTRHKLWHIWAIVTAIFLTVGMVATYAFGASGIGDKPGSGRGNKSTHGEWFVDDNNHAPTVDSVRWFVTQMMGGKGQMTQKVEAKAQSALNQAVGECQARGGTNCRLVAVGVALTDDGIYDENNVIDTVDNYKKSLASFSWKQLSYNG
ncbi:hypothetical protein, partial [Alloscardovia macacae]|uniref:hypothetical protein n=1 Tax=Alloscardovia macacae TaxID=1160091 RepID=UPI0035E94956